MNNKNNTITSETVQAIIDLRSKVISSNLKFQKQQVKKDSPYSDEINKAISNYDEFYHYYTLGLKEAKVTRLSLIKDIDFDLWVTNEGCTNRELLSKGRSPYAYDDENGKIEIHHIGQKYDAPFAELTIKEHNSLESNKFLHTSTKDSWRRNSKLEKDFRNEYSRYWKKRLNGDFTVVTDIEFKDIEFPDFTPQDEIIEEIKKTIEILYDECYENDLYYLSDLAKSYAFKKRIGVSTMSEFIFAIRDRENDTKSVKCSFCGSEEFISHGTYTTSMEKVQRYKCKKCDKVFTAISKSLISGSSFSFIGWIRFIDCVYNGYTLKQISKTCNISVQTAHDNRLKLFYALKVLDDKLKLSGNVVIDETYIPLSYKGNHSKQESIIINRKPHKRGKDHLGVGLNENQVCIVCALDEDGNSVAHVAGVKNSSFSKLKYSLDQHIDAEDVTCIYSDMERAIFNFAKYKGIDIKQAKLIKKGSQRAKGAKYGKEEQIVNRYLQRINSYHSRLKKFINQFSGTSTDLLPGYLYLFSWKERNKNTNPFETYMELLSIMTEPNMTASMADLSSDKYWPDAYQIENMVSVIGSKNYKRNTDIYRKYADGMTIKEIAKQYKLSYNTVDNIIISFRKHGLAYKTKKEIEREQQEQLTKLFVKYENNKIWIRNMQIYKEKQQWSGPLEDFYKYTVEKYKISKQRVKNNISEIERIIQLKKDIFIYEDITYNNLEQVYKSIYSDYKKLKQKYPNISINKSVNILQDKYNYKIPTLYYIIKLMSEDNFHTYFKTKRRLSTLETFNRDKALFIDFLRWTGIKSNFFIWASEKYNISQRTVYMIIQLCLLADPKRYEIV